MAVVRLLRATQPTTQPMGENTWIKRKGWAQTHIQLQCLAPNNKALRITTLQPDKTDSSERQNRVYAIMFLDQPDVLVLPFGLHTLLSEV